MKGIGGGLSNQQPSAIKTIVGVSPGGECGTLVSDLFPHLRECMDDICLIKSMNSNDNEHYNATLGCIRGHSSLRGLALDQGKLWFRNVNSNLPSFMVLAAQLPYAGTQVYGNDFLRLSSRGAGCSWQRTNSRSRGGPPQENLQRLELGLAAALNERHLRQRGPDSN